MAKPDAPKSKLAEPVANGKTKIPKDLNHLKVKQKEENLPLVDQAPLEKAKEDQGKDLVDTWNARKARKPNSPKSMLANPGINTPMGTDSKAAQGESMGGFWAKTGNKKQAVATHKQSLQNIKDAPKPNLPKSELKKDDEPRRSPKQEARAYVASKPSNQGVHESPSWQPEKGKSFAGTLVREAHTSTSKNPNHKKDTLDHAKEVHMETIQDARKMKKPNLPKSEAPMAKNNVPHELNSPEDLAHDVKEHTKKLHTALSLLDKAGRAKMMEHLKGANKPGWNRSEANKKLGEEHHYHAVKAKYMEKCGMTMSKDEGMDDDLAMSETSADKLRKAAKEIAAMAQPMAKARQDEGLSPQRKASQRAKRNDRSMSLKPEKTTLKQWGNFNEKGGAVAGKPGQKIYGTSKAGHKSVGVHGDGDRTSKTGGQSVAGVNAEWSKKHKNPAHAEHARQKAHTLHTSKLAEMKAQPKPNLPKSEAPMAKGMGVNVSQSGNGTSVMGESVRRPKSSQIGDVKAHAKGVLNDIKSTPKPSLPKSEMQKSLTTPEPNMLKEEMEKALPPTSPKVKLPPKGSRIRATSFTPAQVNKLQEAGYHPTLVNSPAKPSQPAPAAPSAKPMKKADQKKVVRLTPVSEKERAQMRRDDIEAENHPAPSGGRRYSTLKPASSKSEPIKKAKEDEGKSDQGKV